MIHTGEERKKDQFSKRASGRRVSSQLIKRIEIWAFLCVQRTSASLGGVALLSKRQHGVSNEDLSSAAECRRAFVFLV